MGLLIPTDDFTGIDVWLVKFSYIDLCQVLLEDVNVDLLLWLASLVVTAVDRAAREAIAAMLDAPQAGIYV